MVEESPTLSRNANLFQAALTNPGTASTFQPISHEAGNLDGLNVHDAIID